MSPRSAIGWLRQHIRSAAAASAALGVGAAGLVAVVASDGVAAGRYDMGDGAAWLPNSTAGELVLVDGTTGRVVARAGGVGTGALAVTQAGAGALVVNRDVEAVFRVSGETQELVTLDGTNAGVRFPGAEAVAVGTSVAYVVQPSGQAVRAVDPVTLRPLDASGQAFTGQSFAAVVDAEDRLWVLDRDAGRVHVMKGAEQQAVTPIDAGADADLVLAGSTPVVVDRGDARLTRLDPTSARAESMPDCAWFAPGDAVEVAGTTSGRPWVALAVSAAGRLAVTDLSSSSCPRSIALAEPGDNRFGRPVEADGLVYVPVLSTGRVIVVDPAVPAVVADPVVVDTVGTAFELLVEDGLVFFNAPFSHEAGVVHADGRTLAADKSEQGEGGTGTGPGTAPGDLRCSVDDRTVAPGASVILTASSAGGPGGPSGEVRWEFGDASRGSGNPVTHRYRDPGTYRPTASADKSKASCPEVVVSAESGALKAKILGPRQAVAGVPTNFRDGSSGSVAERAWRLPEGEPATSGAAEVTVVYHRPGVRKITLTVTGPDSTTDSVSVQIEVVPGQAAITTRPPPVAPTTSSPSTPPTTGGATSTPPPPAVAAAFDVVPPTGVAGEPVAFIDRSTGGHTIVEWTFPGATPARSTDARPAVVWASPGTYEVSLTVTGAGATTSARREITIAPADVPTVTTTTLPQARQDEPYSTSLTAAGGVPPYHWSATTALPSGIALQGDGTLAGTPRAEGATTFAVTATDARGRSSTLAQLTIVVRPRLRIAFTTNRDGNHEIYVMKPDGSGQTRLTNHPAEDYDPAWSPDGRQIAFWSNREGDYDIYVMDADGRAPAIRLTRSAGLDQYARWSPDGRRIAFASERDGGQAMFVMNADGSGQTRVTAAGNRDREPSWSPDGRRLTYTSHRDGNWECWVMNADGSGQVQLTPSRPDLFDHDRQPSWSPDGRRIAFSSSRDHPDGSSDEIYVMNADGSGQTRLTVDGMASRPSWSPDGSRIALVSIRDGNENIYVMNADGTGPLRLTDHGGSDSLPSWSP